ncbi:hypothetical protein DV515_00011633 [Chloebia gouldiae]|uniref:Otospiralin n=3 Tax=Passeroidea TaxID=175121 RepID=A0A3L8S6L3_CHLGU|nr:hypothetical protein DV515_00011633 [Chloebia gouldiae]
MSTRSYIELRPKKDLQREQQSNLKFYPDFMHIARVLDPSGLCLLPVRASRICRLGSERESWALQAVLVVYPDARSIQDGDDLYGEAAALPYWPFSSNDFWSYVEYFRTVGAYNRINDMARAFFAQFPFGSHLGYHVRDHEH